MGAKLEPLNIKKLGKDAEVEVVEVKPKPKCEHGGNLRYVDSQGVECSKCRVGFYIGAGDRLKDGHLYHRDMLIF